MTVRYAIYFAPPRNSALWQAGCRWLGRDPESGARFDAPSVPQCSAAQWARDTVSARRYGFHATLKAPFRLTEGRTEVELIDAMADFAARQRTFTLPCLEVAELGDFLALRPTESNRPLAELAAACVTQFDGFRRPPQADETARRLAAGLTAPQQALLTRWGYPYVLDEWRFHLTLTDRLAAEARQRLVPWLDAYFRAALGQPVMVEDVALFVERQSGGDFALHRRFVFGGAGTAPNVA